MSHVELRTQHETRTQDLLNDVPDSISLRRLSRKRGPDSICPQESQS